MQLKSCFTMKSDRMKGGRRPPGGGMNRTQANRYKEVADHLIPGGTSPARPETAGNGSV